MTRAFGRDIVAGRLPYRRLTLVQGTRAWHDFRRSVIGASDAPTIMGENPWKSAAELLREKHSQADPWAGNAMTRRGSELEPAALMRIASHARHQESIEI